MASAHQRITAEATTEEEVKFQGMGGRGEKQVGTLKVGERMPERERESEGHCLLTEGATCPESLEVRAPPQTAQD